MGEGEEVGIVPRFARELFDRIEGTSDEEVSVGGVALPRTLATPTNDRITAWV